MFKARRILVPFDLAPGGERMVRMAADLARRFKGRLLLLHVFDTRAVEDVYKLHGLGPAEVRERMRANAESVMARIRKRPWLKGMPAEVRYASGLPPAEICAAAAAWKADLIMLGRSRRSGLAHLLYGTTADGVVREAPCAVMVLAP